MHAFHSPPGPNILQTTHAQHAYYICQNRLAAVTQSIGMPYTLLQLFTLKECFSLPGPQSTDYISLLIVSITYWLLTLISSCVHAFVLVVKKGFPFLDKLFFTNANLIRLIEANIRYAQACTAHLVTSSHTICVDIKLSITFSLVFHNMVRFSWKMILNPKKHDHNFQIFVNRTPGTSISQSNGHVLVYIRNERLVLTFQSSIIIKVE